MEDTGKDKERERERNRRVINDRPRHTQNTTGRADDKAKLPTQQLN